MQKRWRLLDEDPVKTASLQTALGIHPLICRILVQRKIESFEQAKKFFRPSLDDLHDPWLMKDMDKAVLRILEAIDANEKILIFGDYDVDGTTAVACIYQFLYKITEPELLDFYIPHRYKEGYGISKAGIDFARENGFSLVISVDCGIKSVDLISNAIDAGIDFIVCDHHLPDSLLPPATAILNPKQPGCNYPFKELCGCGIGFKLISAIAMELGLPENDYLCYLDLVATASAADIVSMTGENRILTFHGLKKANEDPNYGIRALQELSSVKKEIDINALLFMIAPRINAAGRMGDARKAVQLFVAGSFEEAMQYARMLHTDNTERRDTDSNITDEAIILIEQDAIMINRKTTVLYQPHWHKGVIGIVASRLIERYHRPTIVLTKSGDLISGSARSVTGFNLYEAIHGCREHLLGYGGHAAAAGLTLQPDQLDLFSEKFEEIVSSTIDPLLLIPEIIIDTAIPFKDLSIPFLNIIKQMEPFGPGNSKPVFITRNVLESGQSKIIKEKHIRFLLNEGGLSFSGIGFNMADKFPLLQTGKAFDIVFTLNENEWNGNKILQLKVIDFRKSEP